VQVYRVHNAVTAVSIAPLTASSLNPLICAEACELVRATPRCRHSAQRFSDGISRPHHIPAFPFDFRPWPLFPPIAKG
jgi:hypothetical protein